MKYEENVMKMITAALALFISAAIFAPAQAAKVSPTEINGATTVDAATAKQLFDRGVVFVDVRKNSDWEAGRVPGAVHLELKKVLSEDKLVKVASKATEIVMYCNGAKCMRSSKAAAKAVSWGFAKVYYFRDGFPAWEAAGYAVE
jgi:rhodanese-related sulfurtransferase